MTAKSKRTTRKIKARKIKTLGDTCSDCERTDVLFNKYSIYCKACHGKRSSAYFAKRYKKDNVWREEYLQKSAIRQQKGRYDLCKCGNRKTKVSQICFDCKNAPSPRCIECGEDRNTDFVNNCCRKCFNEHVYIQRRESGRAESIKKAARRHHLMMNYGITQEEFVELYKCQGEVCAICKGTDWGRKGPVVDHDHTLTGKQSIRGIICLGCNWALGKLGDNYEGIMRAAEYLKRFEGRQ